MPEGASLTIWGAAQQVTGSLHLLDLPNGTKILVDCGFDMDHRPSHEEPLFPFLPSDVDVVLLTHAHMDHSGHLPNLVKHGFEGQVHCTYATCELVRLLFMDSAKLNARDKKRFASNPKKLTHGPLPYHALYNREEVEDAMNVFACHEPDSTFPLPDGTTVRFLTAGHLLGAVHIVISYWEGDTQRKIAFTGDLGRQGYPLLKDPVQLPPVDFLITETTYGNRSHKAEGTAEEILETVIREACVAQPGRLIIPAFSVGRTQALLYTLNKLHQTGRLPPIRIFADSPLALQSTRVYAKYVEDMNAEARSFARDYQDLFDFEHLQYVRNFKQSQDVNNYLEPCIIIASSGMVEGGRITHHIKTNLQNPFATIFFIGYSSPGTFGHELLNGVNHVKTGKDDIPIMAKVKSTDIFSGHGDFNDLMQLIKSQSKMHLKRIFLVHGEESAMRDFQQSLDQAGYGQTVVAEKGITYTLN